MTKTKPKAEETVPQAFSWLPEPQRRRMLEWVATLDIAIAYFAKEIPSLGNMTAEGLVEHVGAMKELRKDIEKVEKILIERLKSLLNGRTELSSDNYDMTLRTQERNALNQTAAKEYFQEQGILDQFMSTTEVETLNVRRR